MPHIGLIPKGIAFKLFSGFKVAGLQGVMLHVPHVLLGCFRGV